MNTTNATTDLVDLPVSRLDRRRAERLRQKAEDYRETGFDDRATYAPVAVRPQRAGKDRFTPEQLHQRAVQRLTIRTHQFKQASLVLSHVEILRMADRRAPHAMRGTAEHLHFDRRPARARARAAYQAGLLKPQPIMHMHASARFRAFLAAQPQPLAA